MGEFVPILMAFIFKLCDINIFKEESNAGCEPLVSSLIFSVALLIILLKLRLYPDSFRKLKGLPSLLWNVTF